MKTAKLLESKSFQDILKRLISFSKIRSAEIEINKDNGELPGIVSPENFMEAIKRESSRIYGEMTDFMRTLTDDEILYVEAVMLHGRRDFNNIEDAAEHIRTNFDFDRDLAIEYILSKKVLHEYLERGMNDIYKDFEDEDDQDMSWDEALEKAKENPEGKATENFIEACVSYVQSVIRDKQSEGYLTDDEEYLPGYALDMLDGWEVRMTESLYSYRNESMKWVIDKIDEWEDKLNEEFP